MRFLPNFTRIKDAIFFCINTVLSLVIEDRAGFRVRP